MSKKELLTGLMPFLGYRQIIKFCCAYIRFCKKWDVMEVYNFLLDTLSTSALLPHGPDFSWRSRSFDLLNCVLQQTHTNVIAEIQSVKRMYCSFIKCLVNSKSCPYRIMNWKGNRNEPNVLPCLELELIVAFL